MNRWNYIERNFTNLKAIYLFYYVVRVEHAKAFFFLLLISFVRQRFVTTDTLNGARIWQFFLYVLSSLTGAHYICFAHIDRNHKWEIHQRKKFALSNWQFRWTETLGKFILFCFQSITVIHLCVLLSSVMVICVLWRTKIKIFSIKTARTVCYASIYCRSGAYGTHSWSRNIHRNQNGMWVEQRETLPLKNCQNGIRIQLIVNWRWNYAKLFKKFMQKRTKLMCSERNENEIKYLHVWVNANQLIRFGQFIFQSNSLSCASRYPLFAM